MNRADLLNYLIRRYNYRSYLEIGCAINKTFNSVGAAHKVGVDPRRGGTLQIDSDGFFKINRELFDLIFIDGLHLREQVLSDVNNSLKALAEGGTIVLHDCLPRKEEHQLREWKGVKSWTGDVWKAAVELRTREDCDLAVLNHDWGLGLLLPRQNTRPLADPPCPLTWEIYRESGHELLRVITGEELDAFLPPPPESPQARN